MIYRELRDHDKKDVMEIEELCFSKPFDWQILHGMINAKGNYESISISTPDVGSKKHTSIVAYCFYKKFETRMVIHRLAVHPSCQRRKLGTALFKYIAARGSFMCDKVVAVVEEEMLEAQLFFKKMGMIGQLLKPVPGDPHPSEPVIEFVLNLDVTVCAGA